MRAIHKTGDGRIIPIIAMKDDHLVNTINSLFVKQVKQAKARMSMNDKAKFYLKGDGISEEDFYDFVENKYDYTKNLILEALRRDSTRRWMLDRLGEVRPEWGEPQQFEIEGVYELPPSIGSGEDDDYDEYDEYDIDLKIFQP